MPTRFLREIMHLPLDWSSGPSGLSFHPKSTLNQRTRKARSWWRRQEREVSLKPLLFKCITVNEVARINVVNLSSITFAQQIRETKSIYMRTFTLEISKPRDADDFEDYCADIYSVVFEDPTPKRNGRTGQSQGGVDIFVEPRLGKRKGIQCKRYYETKVTEKIINDEVAAADAVGWNVGELIVATTSPSDSKLVKYTQDLSDVRAQNGEFKVSVEFWGDICNHINRHPILQKKYSPNAPGAVFDELRTSSEANQTGVLRTAEAINMLSSKFDLFTSQIGGQAFLSSLATNENSTISRQLDKIVQLVREMSYNSASALLSIIFEEFSTLNAYQKARWHLLSGIVDWHMGDAGNAALKFDTAYDIYPDDDRISAGKIRGFLLAGRADDAIDVAEQARLRFPDSVQVWLAWANTRVALKQYLAEADLPLKFEDNADALQMMAISFHDAGDQALSLAHADRALRADGASFYTWSNVLFVATDFASRDPFLASVGLLPTEVARTLKEVCECFEPRDERLWRIEGGSLVADVAANLAVGRLLLGDASACLTICDEAEVFGEPSPKFAAPRVYAYRQLGDLQNVIDVGTPHLRDMHISAQMMVGESAAILGMPDLVHDIAALPAVAADVDAKKTAQALMWIALRNSGDITLTAESLDGHDFETETALVVLNAAARIYLAIGKEDKASILGKRIATLVTAASAQPVKIQAVDTLTALGDYQPAIALLTSVPGVERSRELQTRLLEAYAKGGYRAKARSIVDSAPPHWFDDDAFVGMAIIAAQQANDWHRLKPLALRQKDRCPTDARAWEFWYRVALQTLRPAEIRRAFSEAPLELNGEPKVIRRVALAELQYGDAELGMRRLYRLFRCNLDNANVGAGFVTALLTAEDIPWGAIPATISAGVAATLHREDGSSFTLVIDPTDVGALPAAQNYLSRDSAFAANFIGKIVGDTVTIRHPMGEHTTYRVGSLLPASRHLLGYAHKLIEESVEPIPGFLSVSVKDGDGNVDMSRVHAQLKRVSEGAGPVIDGYRQGHLTVGLCAQLLGRSPVDLLLAWGPGQPPLVVAEGRAGGEPTWRNPLALSSSCVLDCITLVELGLFKALRVLGLLPHPIVSQRTYDLLLIALDEAKNERSVGRAAEVGGKLAVLRYTAEDRRRKVELLASIMECVERHCEVAPAYGPTDVPSNFLNFKGVLDDESYDAIALCLERGVQLVSIDARLRALALSGFEVSSVSPQSVITQAAASGQFSLADHRQYLMQSLLSNRTYVSISSHDFLWMLSQAGWSSDALDVWSEVLSSAGTLFESAVNVVCGVFQTLHVMDIQLGALACIVEQLASAIHRHPAFRPSAEAAMRLALQRTVVQTYEAPPWHPTFSSELGERAAQLWAFIQDSLSRAKDVPGEKAAAVKHNLTSLYCARRPILLGS
ncbi:PIN domain-containing protein [Paraburkholderia aspalathi]|uniref:PIN domain-containing protein n=1 Tax=Paraburkholderia aspalathi TaxID=1324617 RepID=UPI0038BC50AF